MKGVLEFLGLTWYYRKFIRDFGKVVKPLTNPQRKKTLYEAHKKLQLLSKRRKSWPHHQSWSLLVFTCILNWNVTHLIGESERSLCNEGIQWLSLVRLCRMGTLLNQHMRTKLMALVLCIQYWRHYLLDKKFTLYTNHNEDAIEVEGDISISTMLVSQITWLQIQR